MARVKGCINEECTAFKKKITYGESEGYCSKCGNPIVYVCKKCYTPLDEKGKYCAFHQAEREDKKVHAKKVIVEVGGTIGGVIVAGVVAMTKGKKML